MLASILQYIGQFPQQRTFQCPIYSATLMLSTPAEDLGVRGNMPATLHSTITLSHFARTGYSMENHEGANSATNFHVPGKFF